MNYLCKPKPFSTQTFAASTGVQLKRFHCKMITVQASILVYTYWQYSRFISDLIQFDVRPRYIDIRRVEVKAVDFSLQVIHVHHQLPCTAFITSWKTRSGISHCTPYHWQGCTVKQNLKLVCKQFSCDFCKFVTPSKLLMKVITRVNNTMKPYEPIRTH